MKWNFKIVVLVTVVEWS